MVGTITSIGSTEVAQLQLLFKHLTAKQAHQESTKLAMTLSSILNSMGKVLIIRYYTAKTRVGLLQYS